MTRIPVVDPGCCKECDACIEVCPTVFRKNEGTGLIEVVDLPEYPVALVDDAISICPEDCIIWERG